MDKDISDDCANMYGVYINTRQITLKTKTGTKTIEIHWKKSIYTYFVRTKSTLFSWLRVKV